jgi:hypothetical protein
MFVFLIFSLILNFVSCQQVAENPLEEPQNKIDMMGQFSKSIGTIADLVNGMLGGPVVLKVDNPNINQLAEMVDSISEAINSLSLQIPDREYLE